MPVVYEQLETSFNAVTFKCYFFIDTFKCHFSHTLFG